MHMAMAICSCSKQHYYYTSRIFTNTISFSLNHTNSYLKVSSYSHPHVYSHSSSNYSYKIVQDDKIPIRLPSAREMEKILDIKVSEIDLKREEEWHWNEVMLRRKRRRKRRIASEGTVDKDIHTEDEKYGFVDDKRVVGRFMTPKEEATYSWYLKERARIEAVRVKLVAEMGHELASSQWAKAAGMSQHSLDMILCNGRESEEIITSCYMSLVVSVASSYQGKGLSLKDLTQEGCIGLLRGAIKFNPEKGYKLSTYAYWWIRQAITRAIYNKSRIIRLPGSINEQLPKICEANTLLSRRLQRYPTYEEIAEEIDVNASVVRLALERNRNPISLDEALTSQGCMSLQDIIAGPDEMTPESMMKKEMLKPEIQKLLRPLCDREAHILRLHYGLNGDTPWSFEEIGRLLKLSRERVRQINSTALLKLQETRGIHDLNYFIL